MIRVLLADDNASIRGEMRILLELEKEIEVIGEAADGWEAVKGARTLRPDIILMDKAMPSLDGIEATRLIKKDQPGAKIIFLAAEDTGYKEALQAGAEAFLLKDQGFDAVVKTMRKAIELHPAERTDRGIHPQSWLLDGFRRLWAQSPALAVGLIILSLLTLSDLALLILPYSLLTLIVRVVTNYSLATISLLFGLFFFAYAVKYYTNIALILLFNGENGLANGHGESQVLRNGLRNGLRKLIGNGVEDAFANGYHLQPEAQPFVSIHLPLYNEKKVVDRLLTACTSLDYENYEVVVADDSTDETTQILERWAEHPRVKISHRQDRRGFKGGALQVALQRTDPRAEFIVVFDADFIPPPDIITRFLAYFHNGNGDGQRYVDDRVAAVQGYQWHMLNANENWITRGIRVEFSGSYVIERPGQQLLGSMKMIAGSVFMIRADLLRQHGWSTSITEDWELTLRLYLDGYKVLYTPFIQAPAECISRFQALVRQRMRWARGHTFNVKRYFWRVLTSPNISWREKAEFLYYSPYYLQSVFFVIGTACWFTSELIFHQRIPYWTALLGWSLLFTNIFALVMANLSGLFLERGVHHNWSGIFSSWLLSNLLVPFQAYAALRGLLDKDEGGWDRTPKSGRITEILGRLWFGKKLRKLLPKSKKIRLPERAPAYFWQMPIEKLGLSLRVCNLLRGAGITQVGQILDRLDKAQEDLLAIRGFGPKAFEEVKRALEERGFLFTPKEVEDGIPEEIYETPIERLNLSIRVFNLLKGAGINLVGQILHHLDKAKEDLLAIHYFGPIALLEVKRALYRQGLLSASQVPLEIRLPSLAPPKLVPLPSGMERLIAQACIGLLKLIYLTREKLEDKGLRTAEKMGPHCRWGARGSLRPPRLRPIAHRRLVSPASAIIVVILAAMLGLTVMALKVEAAADNSSTFWFYDDTTPLTYMMYQSQPSGTSQSEHAWVRFYSDTFEDSQEINGGTATVYIYATNTAGTPKDVVVTLYVDQDGSEVATLGNGTVTVPRKVDTPTLYTTSFSHSAFDFRGGDRLELEVAPPGAVTAYWDGEYNASRLEVGIIVPEGALALLALAPLIPWLVGRFRRSGRIATLRGRPRR